MKFNTVEEFWDYLESAYNESTETYPDEDIEVEIPEFDKNSKALNVLFRNVMNGRDFNTAFGIIAYANEHQITLIKGH